MRRNATLSLDDLDPDVIEAARDVARRAGVPLETWLETVVAPEVRDQGAEQALQPPRAQSQSPAASSVSPSAPASVEPAGVEGRRRKRDTADHGATQRAREQALESVSASLPRVTPTAPTQAPEPEGSGTAGASIGEMMARLDALDGAPTPQRNGPDDAAARAIERLDGRPETRLAATLEGGKPAGEMVARLAEIERRMSEMHGQLAGPRPLGRRGRPLAAEMRDAVEQVRKRQRELDASGTFPPRPAPAVAVEPSPAITDLQRETSRLRESLGSLATGRDVGALEEAMKTLASDVQRARAPADLAAIAKPIEAISGQVGRLADEVAENVHSRISGEVARLATKVEGALATQPSSNADRGALDSVFRELDEIRRLIGALAGPERIQGLAQGLQAVSAQISQLQGGMTGKAPGVDELKPLLEEIRRDLKAPDASKAILGRIDALADKVERVGVNPVGDLLERLETLGENLLRPAPQDGELANIQTMLRGLAEKVDQVGSGGGRAEGLDALEKQIVAIARRLDARGADPAVIGLERMMQDLLGQVASMCEGNAVEAAVERATRRALADTARSEGGAPAAGTPGSGMDQLRADLAELGARQIAADRRIEATMGNLNAVLERLVERLGPAGDAAATRSALPAAIPVAMAVKAEERPLGERLSAAASPAAMAAAAPGDAVPEPAPQARQTRRPEAPRGAAAENVQLGDDLLEPGARRPRPNRTAGPDQIRLGMPGMGSGMAAGIGKGGDIKANFIAAARRAAQAAQTEIETPAAPVRARGGIAGETAPTAAAKGLGARLRGEIDSRRRPLLLGLAAIVLVLGAYQAFDTGGSDSPPEPTAAATTPVGQAPKTAEAPPAVDAVQQGGAQGSLQATVQAAPQGAPSAATPTPLQGAAPLPSQLSTAKPAVAEPQTTQSITESAPARPTAALATVPRVAGMDSLKADLAGVPAALSPLRQAALEGDRAAVYELASREADGRGVARDLGIAAKLYEKLAASGYAPAQFKLGNAYEKGSGVTRDLEQAKLWYGRAAEQGNVRSMHNLAVLYAENPAAGGKPDFATASSWFRRAAEYGVRDSQYNLAVLYARGLGLSQDLLQSYGWFSAAAAQGDEEAGKKRDDVAGKLSPKDLATAKSAAAAFKARTADPAANEPPAAKASAAAPVSLIGAPPPGSPTPGGFSPVRPAASGV